MPMSSSIMPTMPIPGTTGMKRSNAPIAQSILLVSTFVVLKFKILCIWLVASQIKAFSTILPLMRYLMERFMSGKDLLAKRTHQFKHRVN
jgi:hypothetical protein